MNCPGLPLFSSRPRRSVRFASLRHQAGQLLEDRLTQRVHLLVGQVEGDERDPAVQLFQSECAQP